MAADDMVVVSGRDAADRRDLFVALDLSSGSELWLHHYDAVAELDYGNSPRATPAAAGGLVVTLGATGILSALDGQTGVALWKVDLASRFNAPVPTWGFSGSPLVIDETIYLQIAKESSLVAIDLFSGQTRWQVAGKTAAYASLMPMGDGKTIVGVDESGYFARRAGDGAPVWSYQPEISGDFGVPTPVPYAGGVIFTSENNGVQLIKTARGTLAERPTAINDLLIPDTHTPVLVGEQLLVAHEGLHSLDVSAGLREKWSIADSVITSYASVIASNNRAIVTTEEGQWLLFEFDDDSVKLLDQKTIASTNIAVLSHPAIVGDKLLLRTGKDVRCFQLADPT